METQASTRQWVVKRSFAWAARFRRLAQGNERLRTTLEGFRQSAFALLAPQAALPVLAVLSESASGQDDVRSPKMTMRTALARMQRTSDRGKAAERVRMLAESGGGAVVQRGMSG